MRNNIIRDDQITASSTYSKPPEEFYPYHARIDNPGRWCCAPNKTVGQEYLQVYNLSIFQLSFFEGSRGKIAKH